MKQAHTTAKGNQEKNRSPKSHGGDRWAAETRWGISADKFIDFSASINPMGPSPYSLQAIQENLLRLEHYPEPRGLALKRALAEYLQTDEEQIVLGNGSLELIYLCARMFGRKRVIVLAPSFTEYGQGVEHPSIIRVALNLSHMHLPFEEIAGILEADDLLFINNPNNPTGNLFCREELLQLLELVNARQAKLVLDEAFIDFVGDTKASLRDRCCHDNLIILGSLTKFFALPGLRIGYALSSRGNIQRMEQLLPPWRMNTLALAAGAAALQDHEYIEKTIALTAGERSFITSELRKMKGLAVYHSRANFVLVDACQRGIKAGELLEKMGSEGILIRDCSNFYNLSPYHFRLAVRGSVENQILLRTLRKVFD